VEFSVPKEFSVPLTCPNCQTVFTDPGGDPRNYYCNVCGYTPLQRTMPPANNNVAVGLMAGAAVGAAFGGVAGAVVGGLIGAFLGVQKHSPPTCQ